MITAGRVFIERSGSMIEIEGARITDRQLRACVEIIGQSVDDDIHDYSKPWLDSRLPDGSRVAATYPPISPEGVVVTIRKFIRHFTTDELVAYHNFARRSVPDLSTTADRPEPTPTPANIPHTGDWIQQQCHQYDQLLK